MDYIFENIDQNSGIMGLVLPISFLQTYKDQGLRKIIFDEWKILGIFELGSIWEPFASVKFNLLVLQKTEPKKIFFTEYLSENTFTSNQKNLQETGEIGEQKITNDFEKYIENIEKILKGETIKNKKNFKLWETPFSELDLDNLKSNFYDPELVDNEAKLQQEKTDILENLVEIIRPKKLSGTKQGFVLKTKDFKYPLEISKLKKENTTSVKLEKGDILFSDYFSENQKFYLINTTNKIEFYASSFLTVLRPKSDKISSEYLFLYLQSEIISKYFRRYTTGEFFQKILFKDLKKLPIILPDKSTQEKSNKIFEKLFLTKKENLVEEINKELFSKENISEKPVQKEFIFEKLENLKIWKQEIIKEILEDDFKELEETKKKKMYKPFLILAGSILEAFLMDWLSEEDNFDYFSSKKILFLSDLIWKLFSFKDGKVPDQKLYEMANFIKEKRNLIHPKKFFNSRNELTDGVCNQVLKDLRIIFKRRKKLQKVKSKN